jgi:hypothetical protein
MSEVYHKDVFVKTWITWLVTWILFLWFQFSHMDGQGVGEEREEYRLMISKTLRSEEEGYQFCNEYRMRPLARIYGRVRFS